MVVADITVSACILGSLFARVFPPDSAHAVIRAVIHQ